jgi:Tfp pilus assembly protein PilV
MPCAPATRTRSLRCLFCAQDGSFLVEALISAMILVIVGLGVLKSLDRGSRLGGEQRVQAVAGNVAQAEQERIRSLPVSQQSNMHSTSARTVGQITYAVDSRAEWVNDTTGDASCTTAGSSADYLKLSTVVSWPRMANRKAVKLESLIAPGVRSFSSSQGSLAVSISDRNGNPVSGLGLNLSGSATLSGTTSAAGCVLWGYLPAGSGYALGFSRPPDWVLTDGTQVANVPASVTGAQTSNIALQYDQGGRIQANFVTKRTRFGTLVPTDAQVAHVTHAGGISSSFAVTSAGGTSNLLFPFTSAYTIDADTCAATESSSPPLPNPTTPAAPSAVSAIVQPGQTTTTATQVQLPPAMITVMSGASPVSGARIRVTTPCGTVYRRTTDSAGVITDPGFPYVKAPGTLAICVSDGIREHTATKTNNNYNSVASVTYTIVSGDPLGTCP